MDQITFGPKAADKIARGVRKALLLDALTAAQDMAGGRRIFWEGELTSACTKPTDGKTSATTCNAKEWVPIIGDTNNPIRLQLGSSTFKIVNRSKTLAAAIGTYIIWVRIKNEWRIIWADC